MDRLLITPPPGRWCQLQYPSYPMESKNSSTLSHQRPSPSPSLFLRGMSFCLVFQHWLFQSCFNLVTSGVFSLSCSLAMFYVIALAGAHKRVINQLREQLVMVGLLTDWWLFFNPSHLFSSQCLFLIIQFPCLVIIWVITKVQIHYVCHFVP